jgi:hypothetical protein
VLLCGRGDGTFGGVTMSFAFSVLLVRELYSDFLVHEVLAVHVLDGGICAFEVDVGNETIAFASEFVIASDFRCAGEETKPGKCVVKDFFIRHLIEIADEEFCARALGATRSAIFSTTFVGIGLVDSDGLPVHSDSIQNVASIFGILLTAELHEAITLNCLRYAILWEMNTNDRPGLYT